MGFFNKFFGAHADLIGRRSFLRNLVTAAPAAVAAAAAIDLKFVPELQAAVGEELAKLDEMVEGDLGLQGTRILVPAPKEIFDPNVRVWRSVAREAGAWADYVSQRTGVAREDALAVCTRLAHLVDADLRAARLGTETKIDVHLPVITRQWVDRSGKTQCEIGLGLHQQKLIDGTDQWQVTFREPAKPLVNSHGQPLI